MVTVVIELGNLNEMGVIGSQGDKGQWQYLSAKGKVDIITIMDNRVKVVIRIVQLTENYGIS